MTSGDARVRHETHLRYPVIRCVLLQNLSDLTQHAGQIRVTLADVIVSDIPQLLHRAGDMLPGARELFF